MRKQTINTHNGFQILILNRKIHKIANEKLLLLCAAETNFYYFLKNLKERFPFHPKTSAFP